MTVISQSATDSAGIDTPRIDRNFVIPGTGQLTMGGYALLFRLSKASGLADGVNFANLQHELDELSDSPLARTFIEARKDDPEPSFFQRIAQKYEIDSAEVARLAAVVAEQGKMIEELRMGYQA